MKLEFSAKINYHSDCYKRDYIGYYLSLRRLKIFMYGLILMSGIVMYLFGLEYTLNGLMDFRLFLVLIGIMFLSVQIFRFMKIRNDIVEKSKKISGQVGALHFYKNRFDHTLDQIDESIFYNSYVEVKKIGKTLFLVHENERIWPFRFNPDEIEEASMEEIEKIIKSKI